MLAQYNSQNYAFIQLQSSVITFVRLFCLERLTVIHTLMAVAAMQGAKLAHQEQFGVQYLV